MLFLSDQRLLHETENPRQSKRFKGEKIWESKFILGKREVAKEIQLFPPYQGQNQKQVPINWNSNKEKKINMFEIATTPKLLARTWDFWAQFALQKKKETDKNNKGISNDRAILLGVQELVWKIPWKYFPLNALWKDKYWILECGLENTSYIVSIPCKWLFPHPPSMFLFFLSVLSSFCNPTITNPKWPKYSMLLKITIVCLWLQEVFSLINLLKNTLEEQCASLTLQMFFSIYIIR